MLAAQDDDGARMSDGQLRYEAMTRFRADRETTTLAHTLYLPGTHPEVTERLRAEREATLMLALIARRWRVEMLPGQTLTFKPAVTLRQAGEGLRARLFAR